MPRKSLSKNTKPAVSFEERLRRAVAAVDVTSALTSPLRRSIENLLRLAARAVGSEEASVLVRDGNKGSLKFLVATGAVADKLLKVKNPAGQRYRRLCLFQRATDGDYRCRQRRSLLCRS